MCDGTKSGYTTHDKKKKKVGILWNIILKALSSAKVTSKVMAKQRRECKPHS